MSNMTFGHKLKSLRGAKVISQRELAAKLKMGVPQLSRIETGKQKYYPSVKTIQRIIKVLRVEQADADYLYTLANRLPPDITSILLQKSWAFDEIRGW